MKSTPIDRRPHVARMMQRRAIPPDEKAYLEQQMVIGQAGMRRALISIQDSLTDPARWVRRRPMLSVSVVFGAAVVAGASLSRGNDTKRETASASRTDQRRLGRLAAVTTRIVRAALRSVTSIAVANLVRPAPPPSTPPCESSAGSQQEH